MAFCYTWNRLTVYKQKHYDSFENSLTDKLFPYKWTGFDIK